MICIARLSSIDIDFDLSRPLSSKSVVHILSSCCCSKTSLVFWKCTWISSFVHVVLRGPQPRRVRIAYGRSQSPERTSSGIWAPGESVPISNITLLVSILGTSIPVRYGKFLISAFTAADWVDMGSRFTDHTFRRITVSLPFLCWTSRSTSNPWLVMPVELIVEIWNVTGLLTTFNTLSNRLSHSDLSAPSSSRAYVRQVLPFPPLTTTGIIPKQPFENEVFVAAQLTEGSVSFTHLCSSKWCFILQSGTVQACGFLHVLDTCLPFKQLKHNFNFWTNSMRSFRLIALNLSHDATSGHVPEQQHFRSCLTSFPSLLVARVVIFTP